LSTSVSTVHTTGASVGGASASAGAASNGPSSELRTVTGIGLYGPPSGPYTPQVAAVPSPAETPTVNASLIDAPAEAVAALVRVVTVGWKGFRLGRSTAACAEADADAAVASSRFCTLPVLRPMVTASPYGSAGKLASAVTCATASSPVVTIA